MGKCSSYNIYLDGFLTKQQQQKRKPHVAASQTLPEEKIASQDLTLPGPRGKF